jgi:ribosomal protein S18
MTSLSHTHTSNQLVELAFDTATLRRLISEGKLHAADFTCLNAPSKRTVWQVLLATAIKRV